MTVYLIKQINSGAVLRDEDGAIIVFIEKPSFRSSKYQSIDFDLDQIDEIIYNENLNKPDGLFNENN
jgi:hypothetical protein